MHIKRKQVFNSKQEKKSNSIEAAFPFFYTLILMVVGFMTMKLPFLLLIPPLFHSLLSFVKFSFN